jgi:PqqD family protein of HPr-rel-A system
MARKFMLSEHVVCRKTGTDLRMLFDRDKGVMYEMNETASAVIDLVSQGPASVDELADSITASFDAPGGEIRDDVARLLADFADAGLVRGADVA